MDPPLISESPFSAANQSAYSLAEIWPFSNNHTNWIRIGGLEHFCSSVEESTVTEQSFGVQGAKKKRKDVNVNVNNSDDKGAKFTGSEDKNGSSKAEAEASSAAGSRQDERSTKPEPPKDYIHLRARRGQATDSHSLAERARREKISERMKILQDLVPGCNKVTGKALVLDEIINYIQSLHRQVEFLSMKLEMVNWRMTTAPTMEGIPSKELGMHQFDASGMIFGSQAAREYPQGNEPEWLHMQLGGSFGRTT